MSDITYVVFALHGNDEMNREEVQNLQSMLGKKYDVSYKILHDTKLLTIKKVADQSKYH